MRCQIQLEGCFGEATHTHHRQLRRHGDERPVNKMELCSWCHAAVHHHPAVSYQRGWLVHSWDDPAAVPVKGAA